MLHVAYKVYAGALGRFDELCGPYATVIDIDRDKLPSAADLAEWTSEQYANALRHDHSCKAYDRNVRQLLHVAYKVAAELGDEYLNALEKYEDVIAQNVCENILERHIKRVFVR